MRAADPGATFNYVHELKGAKTDDVYNEATSWLRDEGATIDKTQRPSEIDAIHGSLTATAIWKRNAEKTMRIKIVETAEGVRVELAMAPGSTEFGYDIYGYQKKIEASWGQLAEELWRRLEGSVQAPP